MRLCVLGPLGSIHMQRWLRYFAERGHEVHGLSYAPVELPLPGVTMHSLLPGASRLERPRRPTSSAPGSVPVSRCRVSYGMSVIKCGLGWLRHGLRGTVRAIKPDILHGHFVVEHGYYAALAGFSPLVVSAWGSDLLVHPQTSVINRLVASYTLRRSALVHTVSPILTDAACELGADPARTLTAPFGIDASWLNLQPAPPGGRPVIISTRMLSEIYDLPTVIQAVDLVRRRHPSALLLLAGDGPLRASLESLVGRLGLGSHVQFLGSVPHARLAELLHGAQVYVSTSLSDGTSVSLLEAMAVGLLPVVSDISANRPWITDGGNGFLAPARDAGAFADKLSRALERPEWRQQAAAKNKELIRARALWEDQMAKVEAAYRRLAGTRLRG